MDIEPTAPSDGGRYHPIDPNCSWVTLLSVTDKQVDRVCTQAFVVPSGPAWYTKSLIGHELARTVERKKRGWTRDQVVQVAEATQAQGKVTDERASAEWSRLRAAIVDELFGTEE
jgi:hypothetical protein